MDNDNMQNTNNNNMNDNQNSTQSYNYGKAPQDEGIGCSPGFASGCAIFFIIILFLILGVSFGLPFILRLL